MVKMLAILVFVAAVDTASLPYKYVGSTFSHIFHRPSCWFAKKIWVEHLELFHFRKEAVGAGYKACRWCLPPVVLQVRGKILYLK